MRTAVSRHTKVEGCVQKVHMAHGRPLPTHRWPGQMGSNPQRLQIQAHERDSLYPVRYEQISFGEKKPKFGEGEGQGSNGPDTGPCGKCGACAPSLWAPAIVQKVCMHLELRTADLINTSHLQRSAVCLYPLVTWKLEPGKHV